MSELPDEEHTTDVTGVVPVVVADERTGPLSHDLRLVCVAGSALGRTFRIERESTVIGRDAVDIQLGASEVSRRHSRISFTGHGTTITDLGSANGTFVNGIRITGTVPLNVGDRIQTGSTIFVLARHDVLEERMRKLERLESLGTLAGGLAHDFNNALSVIVANLGVLREQTTDEEHMSIIDEMRDAASSASSLARRLLKLGRTEPPSFQVVRLSGVLERAISAMRRQAGPDISIVAEVEPDLTILGAQDELHQLLINLFLNARDAMPRGGRFQIRARALRFESSQALAHHLSSAGDHVELTVSDSGTGMDDATLARIFEPFFTTKGPGRGTGLGLAMIHSTVRRHGGAISVESVVGCGTTFQLLLPASPKRVP